MANKYVKFHGIKLADGSEIENLRVEKVTADPTPISCLLYTSDAADE